MPTVARSTFVGKYTGKEQVYPFKIKSVYRIKEEATGHLLTWTEQHTGAPTLHTGAHNVRGNNTLKV